MQSCAGAFAQGVETLDAALSVQVDLDAATHIVGCRTDRDIVGCDVDTYGKTLVVDIGEVLLRLGRVFMGNVQTDMVQTMNLHLFINGTSHDITRG